MKKIFIIITALTSVMFTDAIISAHPGGSGRRMMSENGDHDKDYHSSGKGPHPEERCFHDQNYMKDVLGLNAAQIEKIDSINKEYREQISGLTSKIKPLHGELKNIILAEELDLAAAKSILQKISSIEVEMRFMRIKHRNDIEKVLTPEQKKKFRDEKRRMRD
jgi:Spy/CpxP family protein refolding chaperone